MYRNIVTKTLIATHCCKNIITVTEHYKKKERLIQQHSRGAQITTDKFKQLVGKTEKVSFSSGSESRDTIRRADLLRKRGLIVQSFASNHRLTISELDSILCVI